MSEEITSMFLSEPGQYIAAHGIMIGTTENIDAEDDSINCISLIFLDLEDQLHPVLIHPRGELIEYLISDEFRNLIQSLRQKLVDKDAR
jgi:hypothetical protein